MIIQKKNTFRKNLFWFLSIRKSVSKKKKKQRNEKQKTKKVNYCDNCNIIEMSTQNE